MKNSIHRIRWKCIVAMLLLPSVGTCADSGPITLAMTTSPREAPVFTFDQFVAQMSAPRPVLSARPATDLFSDVNFATETPEVPSPAKTSSGRAAKKSSRGSTTSTQQAYSDKNAKDVEPTLREEAQASGPTFTIVGGWDSRYLHHGEDWVQKGTGSPNDSDSSSIWFARATMEWNGFAAYAGYLQTTDKVDPRGLPEPKYSGEIQVGASYTLSIIPSALETTIGYNGYFLSSKDFIGHSYLGEAFARVAYTQIPFLIPSITTYYLHSSSGSPVGGINYKAGGWIYEARLDGHVKLCNLGSEGSIGLNPFVTLVVDGGFWSLPAESFEPHSIEYGLNFPINLNKNVSLNLHANFLASLIDREGSISQPNFWGGASLSYRF